MKTPEEIKKGLECCGTTIAEGRRTTCNAQCPYINEGIFCRNVLHGDTESYIVQLELYFSQISRALCGKESATICEALDAVSQLKSRLAQVERERDAAVNDLESVDEKYETLKSMIDDVTFNHEPYSLYLDFRSAADAIVEHEHADVWRGVCPENTKEEGK